MKRLYMVTDMPGYYDDCSNYCYAVKAETGNEAVDIAQ